MYETMIRESQRYGADIVVAGHKEELAGKVVEVLHNNIPSGIYKGDNLVNSIYSTMLYNGRFSSFGIFSFLWNKLFRRSILYHNQMQVDDRIFMTEDAACTYPSLLDATAVYVSESTHYHYRQRPNSMVKTRISPNTEIERFNLTYYYLKKRFSDSAHADMLLPQLDFFMLSMLTVRSDLLRHKANDSEGLFPFKGVQSGSKIAICGAGTFGQHLYKQLIGSNDYKVTGWVDPLASEYCALGMPIEPLTALHAVDFDHLLVAFIDETVAEDMRDKLMQMGLPKRKIAMVRHYQDGDIPNLLRQFGIHC
jgi:hypothetical protein